MLLNKRANGCARRLAAQHYFARDGQQHHPSDPRLSVGGVPRRASARGLVRPGPVRPIPLSVTLGRITTYVASRRSLQFTSGHRIERERCKSAHFSAGPGQPPPSADARVRARLVPLSAAAAEAEDRAEAAERRATADGEVSPPTQPPDKLLSAATLATPGRTTTSSFPPTARRSRCVNFMGVTTEAGAPDD